MLTDCMSFLMHAQLKISGKHLLDEMSVETGHYIERNAVMEIVLMYVLFR